MPVPSGNREAAPTAPSAPTTSFAEQATKSTFGADAARLRAAPNFPFFLLHYAQNWEVAHIGLDEPTWLPQLQSDFVQPGVNCKITRKGNEPVSETFRNSHSRLTQRGATILPQNLQLDGFDFDGYLTEVPCAHPRTNLPGTLYHDKWERPIPSEEEGKRIKFARDEAGYNQWRLALVEQGIIAPPSTGRLGKAIARAEYHIGRHAMKTGVPEDVRGKIIEAAQAKLEYIEGARVPQLTATIVDMVPSPARPQVAEIKDQIALIDSVDVLRIILHDENRPTARAAIEQRIAAVEEAATFAAQAKK